jgi:3-deoxy-D-manno-octulosonate 8-phosphate phosphatase (KDO 8-P phosphatase)
MNLHDKAQRIQALVLDIDGVLTDGRITYVGGEEAKSFHVRDGHGLKLAKRAGLRVGALSGRSCEANRRRAAELEFDFLYEGKKDKGAAFAELLAEQGLQAEACLAVGDDVVDLPVLRAAGIGVVVADAPAEMDAFCDFRTTLPGGHGAVREIVEWLLKETDRWENLMQRYVK